jgi:hypothetical protein
LKRGRNLIKIKKGGAPPCNGGVPSLNLKRMAKAQNLLDFIFSTKVIQKFIFNTLGFTLSAA